MATRIFPTNLSTHDFTLEISFFVYFRIFKQTLQFLQQIFVKNFHAVHGAVIRTHDLQEMSLLPLPLDQGSRHLLSKLTYARSLIFLNVEPYLTYGDLRPTKQASNLEHSMELKASFDTCQFVKTMELSS